MTIHPEVSKSKQLSIKGLMYKRFSQISVLVILVHSKKKKMIRASKLAKTQKLMNYCLIF